MLFPLISLHATSKLFWSYGERRKFLDAIIAIHVLPGFVVEIAVCCGSYQKIAMILQGAEHLSSVV
jgi:hypothetical protein